MMARIVGSPEFEKLRSELVEKYSHEQRVRNYRWMYGYFFGIYYDRLQVPRPFSTQFQCLRGL